MVNIPYPILPPNWEQIENPGPVKRMAAMTFRRDDGMMSVIESIEPHENTYWQHVSVARPDRYPTWEEIKFVKDVFIGTDKAAVMILPEQKFFVNYHPNCFHLFHRLDGDTVPGNPQDTNH